MVQRCVFCLLCVTSVSYAVVGWVVIAVARLEISIGWFLIDLDFLPITVSAACLTLCFLLIPF